MPTINFSLNDLQKLVGRKIKISELSELLSFCKAELENYDEKEDVATVGLNDTNLPYLWSVEGIAKVLKGILGVEKGIPLIKIKKGDRVVKVDRNVKDIRPYLFAFAARGKKIDEYLLKQMIQLQEKICENYGRKRKAISIGIYSFKNIQFPLFYKAVDPKSVKFIPLEFTEKLDLNQILQKHPKGKEYAWILDGLSKFPIFMDSKNDVLSFPPIINSNFLGKVEENDTDIFIEVTGIDFEMARVANNIFAHALNERGFDICSVSIEYPDKKIICPDNNPGKIKITKEQVEKLTGISTSEKELKSVLEKARYGYDEGIAKLPSYRRDVLHWVDVVEDFAIAYDYRKINPLPLTAYTVGKTFEIVNLADRLRGLLVGFGYQEAYSPVLSSKSVMSIRPVAESKTIVEIENPMSESFSVVRNWLTPVLLEIFGKNRHVEYPQRIFEQGIVTLKNKEVFDCEVLACASCHKSAGFTEIKQVLEGILRQIGILCEVKSSEHPSFIQGRFGRVYFKNKEIGIIGEVAPQVLANFNIPYPVAGFEINLAELMKLV